MERIQRAAMAHTDQHARRQRAAQQAVQRMLQAFVGGGRGLVQEYDSRPIEQHARERHALLLADGQNARPVRHLIEPAGQVPQVHLPQRVGQAGVVLGLRQARVGHRAAQIAQGQIGPLRQEQRGRALRAPYLALGIRPQASQRAQQRGLAAA
ncbi:hypothetical protein D9M68_568470 [compost metagenome]